MIEVDPSALDQPVQRRIERALLHLQHIVGRLLDRLGDGVAVRGSEEQGAENEEIERALQQLDAFAVVFSRHAR